MVCVNLMGRSLELFGLRRRLDLTVRRPQARDSRDQDIAGRARARSLGLRDAGHRSHDRLLEVLGALGVWKARGLSALGHSALGQSAPGRVDRPAPAPARGWRGRGCRWTQASASARRRRGARGREATITRASSTARARRGLVIGRRHAQGSGSRGGLSLLLLASLSKRGYVEFMLCLLFVADEIKTERALTARYDECRCRCTCSWHSLVCCSGSCVRGRARRWKLEDCGMTPLLRCVLRSVRG